MEPQDGAVPRSTPTLSESDEKTSAKPSTESSSHAKRAIAAETTATLSRSCPRRNRRRAASVTMTAIATIASHGRSVSVSHPNASPT